MLQRRFDIRGEYFDVFYSTTAKLYRNSNVFMNVREYGRPIQMSEFPNKSFGRLSVRPKNIMDIRTFWFGLSQQFSIHNFQFFRKVCKFYPSKYINFENWKLSNLNADSFAKLLLNFSVFAENWKTKN